MKALNTLLALLFLMVSACAQYEPKKAQNDPNAQDLGQMAIGDALNKKYASATLTCNLWIHAKNPAGADAPDDKFTLNLLSDSGFPKTVNLSAQTESHSLTARIQFLAISLQTFEYDDQTGHHALRNSPVISLRYSGRSRVVYSSTQVATQNFQGDGLLLNENIVTPIIAASSNSVSNQTVNYVECSISTIEKPE